MIFRRVTQFRGDNYIKSHPRPRLALTMGDPAGIGPEVVLRAVRDLNIRECCLPLVIGHAELLRRVASLVGISCDIVEIESIAEVASRTVVNDTVYCYRPDAVSDDILTVEPGKNDPRAGEFAYQALISAIDGALSQEWDGIVTAPLSKAALHLAGHHYPGHTEILAERCGVDEFGMMLYIPASTATHSPHGIGVVHVTLHTALADVPRQITRAAVIEKIQLVRDFMRRLGCQEPRIVVNALNPHAGESGIFGREEIEVIAPAVEECRELGIAVDGPLPSDTLYRKALAGQYDAVVAMYHDQGHIPFKLVGAEHAVNVTLGLPIVRTSPSHGTAFDIAWRGQADAVGMIEATKVAAKLCQSARF